MTGRLDRPGDWRHRRQVHAEARQNAAVARLERLKQAALVSDSPRAEKLTNAFRRPFHGQGG